MSEEDMESVVFNHNTMNEITWQQVGNRGAGPVVVVVVVGVAADVVGTKGLLGEHRRLEGPGCCLVHRLPTRSSHACA